MTAVLEKFVEQSSFRAKVGQVYYLSSSDRVLASVSAELLGWSLSLHRHVRLPKEFSSVQVSSVLSGITERNSSKEIVFQCNLSSVSSDLLARGVVNMETIQFQRRAGLSADQAKAIFNTLTTSTCLRQMSFLERFTTNLTDLSAVNPRVLYEVLVKLYRLRLYRTLFTSEQLRFYSL